MKKQKFPTFSAEHRRRIREVIASGVCMDIFLNFFTMTDQDQSLVQSALEGPQAAEFRGIQPRQTASKRKNGKMWYILIVSTQNPPAVGAPSEMFYLPGDLWLHVTTPPIPPSAAHHRATANPPPLYDVELASVYYFASAQWCKWSSGRNPANAVSKRPLNPHPATSRSLPPPIFTPDTPRDVKEPITLNHDQTTSSADRNMNRSSSSIPQPATSAHRPQHRDAAIIVKDIHSQQQPQADVDDEAQLPDETKSSSDDTAIKSTSVSLALWSSASKVSPRKRKYDEVEGSDDEAIYVVVRGKVPGLVKDR
ncbi:hypothetical protein OBBRIDRAFT_831382 [Obba rivulosa]|uniref:Uncharacterized protein n=1 Tax=Obba rivulosa TaxID=1052685 RepID=A0A8E2J7C0_9APHY|nr:hypothetical protein OBBRIDRAFT_831382 [Obba rivulosa]